MIWLFLLLQQSYHARARGAIRVMVQCIRCGCSFTYHMERTAFAYVGQYSSIADWQKDDADEEARDKLQDLLDQDFDCVPCPRCGDFQPEMAAQLKHKRYRGMLRYQALLLCLGAMGAVGALFFSAIELANAHQQDEVDFLIGVVLAAGSGAAALAGLTTWAALRILHARWTADYDPNDPKQRDQRLAEARRWTRVSEDNPAGERSTAGRRSPGGR